MRLALSARARDFHPFDCSHAGRTTKTALRKLRKTFEISNNTSTGSHNSTIRNIFIQQNNYPNFFSGITAI
jgi:hypothetical protein